jgi:predicted esterase
VALSCYLPGGPTTLAGLGRDTPVETPVFQVLHLLDLQLSLQAHGDMDEVVNYRRGQLTAEVLEVLVKDHRLVTYSGMGHEGTMEELEDVKQFLLARLS